jgi:FHS family Na+ dependent glucose MFS transporter 1
MHRFRRSTRAPSVSRPFWKIRPEEGNHLSKTLSYFAAFVALGLSTAALGPTLPGLAEHTRSQLNEISFLFTAHALGYLLGSFQGGRLYDRVPGHWLMAAVLSVMATTLFLAPLMPSLLPLSINLLSLGMAEGALDVGGNTLLVWVHGRRVGPYMNGLHFSFGLGSFLCPIVIAQAVLLSGDITWGYWALALLMLPVAFWLLRLPSPKDKAVSNSDLGNQGHPSSMAETSQKPKSRESVLVALIALLLFLYVGAEAGFGGWIYTYALDMGLTNGTTAAYLTSAFWGALTLGRLLAIPLAARFHPHAILLGDLGGCLASVGLVLVWPNSPAAIWLGASGLGLSMASIFPTAISLAERHVRITGQVTGWFLVGGSIGGMSLPWLMGQLFKAVGPRATMVSIVVDLAAALGVLATLILYLTPDDPLQSFLPASSRK